MSTEMTRRQFARSTGAAALSMRAAAIPAAGASEALVIDSHAHLKHGDAAKTEYSVKAIVEVMAATGIDRSIVFAMSTTTRRSIEMAEAAIEQFPDRLIPYVYALPSYERPVIQELDAALRGKRFRGIKIHAGECRLREYIIDPVFKLAAKHGAPCLVDATGDARVARRLATSFPETTFLFAHMGAYMSRNRDMVDAFIRLAEEFDNVLLDTSAVALVYKMEDAVGRAGAEKLVWGTDGPHKNPGLVSYTQSELDKVQRLEISQADKDRILGGNIAKLLNL